MRPMLVTGFPAGTFQTNCWLVATAPGSEALVVDPGQDALAGIDELCARHRLRPVAALLTHGHLDHVWTVAPLAGAHDIPAFVHPADRHLLTDPLAGFGPEARAAFGGLSSRSPTTSASWPTARWWSWPACAWPSTTPPATPPATSPSARPPEGDQPAQLLAGRPGVRRLDRPHRPARRVDPEMLASLASRFLTLPDETVVLPGHGPTTTVGRERATNPFLAGLDPVAGAEGRRGGPGSGRA